MKNISQIFLLLIAASSVTACGVKGRLKTPEQIERDAAKKAQKEEAKKATESDKQEAKPEEQEEQK